MVDDLQKGKEEYQKLLASANDQAVSTQERDKRKQAAEEKLKQLRTTEDTILQYEKTARESVARELQRMRESILTEIRTVLNAKAQSGGFNLVIDTAAETVNGTPVVMYSKTRKDDT